MLAAPAIADPLPSSIPERVRLTLENRCTICHSDTSAEFGRLDLGHWAETPDGSFSFIHQDSFNKQRSAHHTMGVLLDRVLSSDPDAHMPPGETVESNELEPLVEWLKSQLKS